MRVLQFHQVSSKSDEKQKSFINSQFFCSEFQSVSRTVKIVHSEYGYYIIKLTQMDGKGSPLHRGSVEVSIVHMQVPSAHRL